MYKVQRFNVLQAVLGISKENKPKVGNEIAQNALCLGTVKMKYLKAWNRLGHGSAEIRCADLISFKFDERY